MFRPSRVGRRRVGFTLVELLVVIAIIGILIALLLPAVQAAREAARRSQCSNNCKQMGLALHNYHDSYKAFPMGLFTDTVTPAPYMCGSVWGLKLLPYMEQQALYDQFDHNLIAIDAVSPANVAVIATPVAGFVCPSVPGGIDRNYVGDTTILGITFTWTTAAPSDYLPTEELDRDYRRMAFGDTTLDHGAGVLQEWGIGMFGGDNLSSRISDIKDGTSNTFIVGERTGGDKIYNKNREVDLSGFPVPANQIIGYNGGGWGDLFNGDNNFEGSLFSGIGPTLVHGPCAINCTNMREYGFHSFHPGGAMFTMADGSTKFVSETVAAASFAAQFTRDGGEVLP